MTVLANATRKRLYTVDIQLHNHKDRLSHMRQGNGAISQRFKERV